MQHATNRITISFVLIYPALFRLIPWFPTFCVLRGRQHKNTSDPAVRKRYGYLGAFTGIVLNILLFLGKLIAGILSGGISVIADAFNNLSDAGSSIMTFVGFKMAGMPADSEHPYGHGRMEYVSGIIISFIIMMMGFELGKSSVEKIFSPEKSEFSILAVSVLGASLLVKLWMALFNTKLGRKIDSATMKAAAADSLSDCISTSVVIICMFIQLFSGFELDSYAGIVVALFILYTGFNTFKESLTPLLGTKPKKELVEEIENTVMNYDGIVGVHDLMVHDYGVGRMVISLHAEISSKTDIMLAHELIDLIEDDLREKYRCSVTIHMDPVVVDDEKADEVKKVVLDIIKNIDNSLTIHDFRITDGVSRINVIFDLVTPFGFRYKDGELALMIKNAIAEKDGRLNAVITVERSMC